MARGRGGYSTYSLTNFAGGLNLYEGTDVDNPNQAIDTLNVDFLPSGMMRQRGGFIRFGNPPSLPAAADSISAFYRTNPQFMANGGTTMAVYDAAGTLVSSVSVSAGPFSYAQYAAPGLQRLIYTNGDIGHWDGNNWLAPAYPIVKPTGKFLAVQATDNRLVVAGEAAQDSRVRFSNPGDPVTFETNNYVDLRPGSGAITAAISWREFVFVFKEHEFFVFFGNSTDATGKPIFNYRPVSSGIGSVGPVAVAPEGVYFMNRRGIWLTSGGTPKLMSRSIEPLFTGDTSIYFQTGKIYHPEIQRARLTYMKGRLYCAYSTGDPYNSRVAVYSAPDDWWTIYDLPAASMTPFRIDGVEELIFGFSSGVKQIGRYKEENQQAWDHDIATGAARNAIESYWRQGWVNYGSFDQKTIRQTKLWGQGHVDLGVYRDYQSPVTPGVYSPMQTVYFIPSNTIGTGRNLEAKPWLHRISTKGHVFSAYFYSKRLDKTWRIHSMQHHFRTGRAPEVTGYH